MVGEAAPPAALHRLGNGRRQRQPQRTARLAGIVHGAAGTSKLYGQVLMLDNAYGPPHTPAVLDGVMYFFDAWTKEGAKGSGKLEGQGFQSP